MTTYLNISSPLSVYIPRVNRGYDCARVANILSEHIGVPERIDFVPIRAPNGFSYTFMGHDDKYKSAFVHFNRVYDTELTRNLISFLECENGSYWLHFAPREYFIIVKNRNPIPSSLFNTHQIVENCRLLENKVEKQEGMISTLEKTVQSQGVLIDRLQQTVRQLINSDINIDNNMNQELERIQRLFDDEEDPRAMTMYEMPWFEHSSLNGGYQESSATNSEYDEYEYVKDAKDTIVQLINNTTWCGRCQPEDGEDGRCVFYIEDRKSPQIQAMFCKKCGDYTNSNLKVVQRVDKVTCKCPTV